MRHILAAVLSFFLSLPALASPTGVYFFGDSLTDIGNATELYAQLTGGLGNPPTIPGQPYDAQGRGSNGKLYADVLAEGLGFSATRSVLGGNDFAFGGARTRYQIFGPPFQGILEQVATFRARPGIADSGALYVLWGGSNNLQDLMIGKTVDVLGNPIPTRAETVADLAGFVDSAIAGLYAEGARKILVPNVADLTLAPRIREALAAFPPNVANFLRDQYRGWVTDYNSLLADALDDLANSPNFAGLDIVEFDTFSTLNEIIANAAGYGFTNTTDRCYTGDDQGFTGGGAVCANPQNYLWWDGIHPTTALHTVIGQRMLASVPEPATLLLVAIALAATFRLRLRG